MGKIIRTIKKPKPTKRLKPTKGRELTKRPKPVKRKKSTKRKKSIKRKKSTKRKKLWKDYESPFRRTKSAWTGGAPTADDLRLELDSSGEKKERRDQLRQIAAFVADQAKPLGVIRHPKPDDVSEWYKSYSEALSHLIEQERIKSEARKYLTNRAKNTKRKSLKGRLTKYSDNPLPPGDTSDDRLRRALEKKVEYFSEPGFNELFRRDDIFNYPLKSFDERMELLEPWFNGEAAPPLESEYYEYKTKKEKRAHLNKAINLYDVGWR